MKQFGTERVNGDLLGHIKGLFNINSANKKPFSMDLDYDWTNYNIYRKQEQLRFDADKYGGFQLFREENNSGPAVAVKKEHDFRFIIKLFDPRIVDQVLERLIKKDFVFNDVKERPFTKKLYRYHPDHPKAHLIDMEIYGHWNYSNTPNYQMFLDIEYLRVTNVEQLLRMHSPTEFFYRIGIAYYESIWRTFDRINRTVMRRGSENTFYQEKLNSWINGKYAKISDSSYIGRDKDKCLIFELVENGGSYNTNKVYITEDEYERLKRVHNLDKKKK